MEDPDAKTKQTTATHAAADLMTAKMACELLQVKPATLYTYVSRGLLTPVHQAHSKANLYWREEVQGLRVRSSARQGHGAIAAAALNWGQPVLSTSITEITPNGPRYRSHLASDLVSHPGSFENVAELLWSGVLPDSRHTWSVDVPADSIQRALDGLDIHKGSSIRMMRVFATTATALGAGSLAEELRNGSITHYSRQLLFAFAGSCGLLGRHGKFVEPSGDQPLAAHLLRALGAEPEEDAVHAVNAALILGADHELSPATFVARIAASAGSGLHACIVAALATHRGSSLAGGCDIAEDVFRGIRSKEELKTHLSQAARRRERLTGFSLQLYPNGDPRAAMLIDLVRRTGPTSKAAELALQYVDSVRDQLGIQPNIEAALVLLAMCRNLPERSASALWGVGRSAGWIAHVLEQRLAGFEIRPRAQYISPGLTSQNDP